MRRWSSTPYGGDFLNKYLLSKSYAYATMREPIRRRHKSIRCACHFLRRYVFPLRYSNGVRCGGYARRRMIACHGKFIGDDEKYFRHSVQHWQMVLNHMLCVCAHCVCAHAHTHITYICWCVCFFVYSLALEQDHIKFKLLLWRTLRAYLPRELV